MHDTPKRFRKRIKLDTKWTTYAQHTFPGSTKKGKSNERDIHARLRIFDSRLFFFFFLFYVLDISRSSARIDSFRGVSRGLIARRDYREKEREKGNTRANGRDRLSTSMSMGRRAEYLKKCRDEKATSCKRARETRAEVGGHGERV